MSQFIIRDYSLSLTAYCKHYLKITLRNNKLCFYSWMCQSGFWCGLWFLSIWSTSSTSPIGQLLTLFCLDCSPLYSVTYVWYSYNRGTLWFIINDQVRKVCAKSMCGTHYITLFSSVFLKLYLQLQRRDSWYIWSFPHVTIAANYCYFKFKLFLRSYMAESCLEVWWTDLVVHANIQLLLLSCNLIFQNPTIRDSHGRENHLFWPWKGTVSSSHLSRVMKALKLCLWLAENSLFIHLVS